MLLPVDESYRSYVVRVHRPRNGAPVIRLDIEDLQGGARVAYRGVVAGRVARFLAGLMGRAGDEIRRA